MFAVSERTTSSPWCGVECSSDHQRGQDRGRRTWLARLACGKEGAPTTPRSGNLRAVPQNDGRMNARIEPPMKGKEGSRGLTTSPTKSVLIENGGKSVHTDRIHVDGHEMTTEPQ